MTSIFFNFGIYHNSQVILIQHFKMKVICGIDEAGRGALAGPVVASAVIMKEDSIVAGSTDSKLIKEQVRELLYDKILSSVLEVKTGIIWNEEIDSINILKATMRAMKYCLENLSSKPDKILVDGNYLRFEDASHTKYDYELIVKGDSKIHAISCASIIAKVTRDRIMREIHFEHPEYGFNSHKGYATAKHLKAITEFGLTKYHRKTFCKKFSQINLTFKK